MSKGSPSFLRTFGPGLLVAATGVGAGDLATGAFSGSVLGTAVLWAVLVGAGLKYVLNEGLTRWQLATGETLLEGVLTRIPRSARWLFLLYLVPWSWFVGGALVSACGVTAHAILPIVERPEDGKILFGIVHSVLGLVLVWRGGFAVFSRVMSACIAFMFVTVVATAVLLSPDWGAALEGTFVPRIPDAGGQGLAWTVALLGGIGGTLTILCYGYWIREEGREGPEELRRCRIDLAVGYGVTAIFGLAMVVIGSTIQVEGRGAGLIVQLGDRLAEPLGPIGRWMFLVGAWGAVFSSLLGVWQAVPLLFADWWRLAGKEPRGDRVRTDSTPYRIYLVFLASAPLGGLWFGFQWLQKLYAIVGAAFLPMLAAVLLVWNGGRGWIPERHRNRLPARGVLVLTLAFFGYTGWLAIERRLG